MDKTETQTEKNKELVHIMREEYSKRISEVDAFYKRATNMGVEVNTELLYGCLDIIQHCLDLQQKYSRQFPLWYSSDLMARVLRQNTGAWIHTIQNVDTICTDTMKNMKSNLRTMNKNTVQGIQNVQKIADTCRNFQSNTESTMPVAQKPTTLKESNLT